MNRFSMWFANFMRGRYGVDQLNRFLIIASAVLIAVNIFARARILHFIIVILLIYIYSRMFSRNVYARAAENQKFLNFTSKFRRSGVSGGSSGHGGGFAFGRTRDKDHRILRCPGCGEKLRVPKGAGKIRIRCPHCSLEFTKKV